MWNLRGRVWLKVLNSILPKKSSKGQLSSIIRYHRNHCGRDRVQAKLLNFKQHCVGEGDLKLQSVRQQLKSYQESDWQKGLLKTSRTDLQEAEEHFKVGRSVGDDQTGDERYKELEILKKELEKAEAERSNVVL